jgi:DNA repair exonuclease SbcCD ATPase subunit
MRTLEDFREETRRYERAYWASVRRAEADSKALRESYTPVSQCPVCGLFRPDGHSQKCKDLKPLDISKEEKFSRLDDPFNENTWDDKAIIDD